LKNRNTALPAFLPQPIGLSVTAAKRYHSGTASSRNRRRHTTQQEFLRPQGFGKLLLYRTRSEPDLGTAQLLIMREVTKLQLRGLCVGKVRPKAP
jgi:hypothetical protein